MPVAAGAVLVAVATMIYADAQRARVARPVRAGTLHPAVRRVDARLHVAWIWCAAWAWWTRVRVGDAQRYAAGRLRATRAWPATERTVDTLRRRVAAWLHVAHMCAAAWVWWARVTVGQALQSAAQLDGDHDGATPPPHDEMASRRRMKPRPVPSRSSNSGLGDLDWSSLGRFSASAPTDGRRVRDDADERQRRAHQRRSA
jgi:hypothetical protein